MKTILHTVDINSPANTIYDAITTEQGLAGWWSTRVNADVRVGGIIDFTFLDDFNPDMKITALEHDQHVSWVCVSGHGPWLKNTFDFDIEQRDKMSVLFFRQEYAQELDDEEYGRYNCNWGFYLDSLRMLAETGKGKPFSPE